MQKGGGGVGNSTGVCRGCKGRTNSRGKCEGINGPEWHDVKRRDGGGWVGGTPEIREINSLQYENVEGQPRRFPGMAGFLCRTRPCLHFLEMRKEEKKAEGEE